MYARNAVAQTAHQVALQKHLCIHFLLVGCFVLRVSLVFHCHGGSLGFINFLSDSVLSGIANRKWGKAYLECVLWGWNQPISCFELAKLNMSKRCHLLPVLSWQICNSFGAPSVWKWDLCFYSVTNTWSVLVSDVSMNTSPLISYVWSADVTKVMHIINHT